MKRFLLGLIGGLSFAIPGKIFAAVDPFCGPAGLSSGIKTELGCIQTNPVDLFEKIFSIGSGMAGGIAFLLILAGAFQIMTSAGNPEKLNEGKEMVTGAITGLLLVIFSIFLLKVVGVDILCIPGFGNC